LNEDGRGGSKEWEHGTCNQVRTSCSFSQLSIAEFLPERLLMNRKVWCSATF